MIKASGLAYNSETRNWDKLVVVEFRDRMEAIRWMNFQRDWFTNLKIVEPDPVEAEGPTEATRDPDFN